MIEKKTVLILGAGASKPYGFPLGRELRDSVLQKKYGSWLFDFMPVNPGFEDYEYTQFAGDLAHSGSPSVDAFLEENDRWLDIGKSAIALFLLDAEINCRPKIFPPDQPKDHWYETLWSRLKGSSWALFKKNPLAIVTFNYDRSLEHYLVTVLCNNYNIKASTAMRGLTKMPILHVHGDLGNYIAHDNKADFAQRLNKSRFTIAKQRILIVHENEGQTKDFVLARKLITEAERVLFIGFGYHPKNMAKLGFRSLQEINGLGVFRVLGTHKGIKARDWGRITHRYGFTRATLYQSAGTISEFINEWLE